MTSLPAVTATTAASADITIPDVTGQKAEIARAQLEGLGLTNVELASANPKYSMVLLAKNWTVVSIEPAPGATVASGSPVIVKVYKD